MSQPMTAASQARAYLTPAIKPEMFSRALVEQLLAEHDAAAAERDQLRARLAEHGEMREEWGIEHPLEDRRTWPTNAETRRNGQHLIDLNDGWRYVHRLVGEWREDASAVETARTDTLRGAEGAEGESVELEFERAAEGQAGPVGCARCGQPVGSDACGHTIAATKTAETAREYVERTITPEGRRKVDEFMAEAAADGDDVDFDNVIAQNHADHQRHLDEQDADTGREGT